MPSGFLPFQPPGNKKIAGVITRRSSADIARDLWTAAWPLSLRKGYRLSDHVENILRLGRRGEASKNKSCRRKARGFPQGQRQSRRRVLPALAFI